MVAPASEYCPARQELHEVPSEENPAEHVKPDFMHDESPKDDGQVLHEELLVTAEYETPSTQGVQLDELGVEYVPMGQARHAVPFV